MTLHLEQWNGSSWVTVNIVSQKLSDFKLKIAYSHPSILTFVAHQAHQSTPLEPFTPVRFWDDEGSDPGGTPFSGGAPGNPTFLGHVEGVDPDDDGLKINYTCLDPTARASNEIPVMSTAWADSTTEGTRAVPRLIFNSTIDNDDDWVFCRAFEQNVGEMIDLILTDAVEPLRRLFAAPDSPGAVHSTTDLTGMDFEPQEKVVFTSEPIRSGIQRLLNDWEPEWRLLWYPGSRQWRFGDIRQSPQVTRTLNDFTVANPILQIQLERSLEGRYTAVKIYGPEALENRDISLSGGGLTNESDGPVLEEYGAGAQVIGQNKWQIADSDKRRIGRMLPVGILVPLPNMRVAANAFVQETVFSRSPTLLVRYPYTSGGTDAWEALGGWLYDFINGIIYLPAGTYAFRYNYNPAGGQPNRENPVDVRFIYPSYIAPLSVRDPSSGFEGTANSEYGLENELKIYDEMLAVGFLYGTPVTSATRVAKFAFLADNILSVKKDVIYTGGMTLEGLDYTFQLLGRRVNIDGVNGNGDPLTTGWEAINAIVTEVEYDYSEQLTTVQFSTDQEELVGRDPAQIKQALKIGASYIYFYVQSFIQINSRWSTTMYGSRILGQDITVGGSVTPIIVDPYLGTIDRPIS